MMVVRQITVDAFEALYSVVNPGLWAAATARDPAWDRFGVLFWCEPGAAARTQELRIGDTVDRGSWRGSDITDVDLQLMDWWDEQHAAGVRMFTVMFVAGDRASGDIESFFVYPDQADAREWVEVPGEEGKLLDRAWERLGWTAA